MIARHPRRRQRHGGNPSRGPSPREDLDRRRNRRFAAVLHGACPALIFSPLRELPKAARRQVLILSWVFLTRDASVKLNGQVSLRRRENQL
jgi:hypothetical protein